MYTVYVRLARDVSAEQRQVELQAQFAKGTIDPLNQRVLLGDEQKTPWPLWLSSVMNRYGFKYDHYNWLYLKSCWTQNDAFREQMWVHWLARFLVETTVGIRLKLLWRMRSPGLWPWVFGTRTDEEIAVAMRLEPTILQEMGAMAGPGHNPGDEEAELV